MIRLNPCTFVILHSATRWIKVWEQKVKIKCRNGVCMKNYAERSEAENFFPLKICIFRA